MKTYDNFAKTFAKSRQNMKWEELDFFMDFLKENQLNNSSISILDVGCGSGRLLNYLNSNLSNFSYLGIDSSTEMINEAKIEFPDFNFKTLDMTEIDLIKDKFDIIFFIASFHHIDNNHDRIIVLKKTESILNNSGFVMMTNWNLFSEENSKKYNEFRGQDNDFKIKIGQFYRYYHGFTLNELNNLFFEFDILENKFSTSEKNIISILQKK